MATIITAVRACLEQDGLRYELDEQGQALRFGFRTEAHRWTCIAQSDEQRRRLAFFSIVLAPVERERRGAVMELLSRINWGLFLGSFDIELDTGRVRLRTSVDFGEEPPTTGLVQPLIHANLATMSTNMTAIDRVMGGQASPAEALRERDGPP